MILKSCSYALFAWLPKGVLSPALLKIYFEPSLRLRVLYVIWNTH